MGCSVGFVDTMLQISKRLMTLKRSAVQSLLKAPVCARLYHGPVDDARDNFLPESHPVILRHKDTNTYYLHPEVADSQRKLTHDQSERSEETEKLAKKSLTIDASESPVRLHIKAQSYDLKKMMFFYNETNPHAGLIGNTRQILYDYYQLIGPVKDSWYKVLSKDFVLSELLVSHTAKVVKSQGKGSNQHMKLPTMSDIANMLETLPAKKGASSCKYQSSVTDNLFLIHQSSLTESERVVLEVLAQYAYVDYELVYH